MKKFLPILILLLIAAETGLAQNTILLKNGDILTGTILKQTPEQVSFKSATFGTVDLSPEDIKEIRTSDSSSEAADQTPPPAQTAAEKKESIGTIPKVETPSPQVVKKKPVKMKRWTGQAGLAIAMREKTSSNRTGIIREDSYETYRLYGNVNWKGDRNTFRWDWTYRYSEDEYRIRDDFFNVTQIYKYAFVNKNLYSTAKTLYQRDYNRRIENEFLQTAEMGIKWFDKDSNVQLTTSAGGGYHSYDRIDTSRTSSDTVSKPEFIFDEAFRWNMINTLALTQRYTHLGDLTNYHFLFSAGLENKLIKDLFVRLEYRLDRDTEVYYDDRGYYDKALLTSLLYKF